MFDLCLTSGFLDLYLTVNKQVTSRVRNPPAPISNSLEENNYILQVEQGF